MFSSRKLVRIVSFITFSSDVTGYVLIPRLPNCNRIVNSGLHYTHQNQHQQFRFHSMSNQMSLLQSHTNEIAAIANIPESTVLPTSNLTLTVSIYSAKPYDEKFLSVANEDYGHILHFHSEKLNIKTADFANGHDAICTFVNDKLDAPILKSLASRGVRLIALRCAGFNQVDLTTANNLGITILRVPAYSPHAVAEHTVALILTSNRNIHRAHNRIRESNFALDGLLGFDMYQKTVGIIGTGKIGAITAKILQGFGCKVLCYDPIQQDELISLGMTYVENLSEIYEKSDIISLHCPVNKNNYHLINAEAISKMKTGVMIVNTSRGGLIDTNAIIKGLKSQKIGRLALDVYEDEANFFYEDLSSSVQQDDIFQRLSSFPNVLITGHQAFFTKEALTNIADTTIQNFSDFANGKKSLNIVVDENSK